MATLPSDIPNIEKEISNQQKQADIIQKKLESSSTALGGKGIPTSFDVKNQESLQRIQNTIQTLKNKKIDAQWYPPKDQNARDEQGSSPGIIGSTLDFISRPLYAVVGVTKHAVGQGSDSLYQDIADNMVRNKNTFGDVLKTAGAPKVVSAPLGFALDVMMDPINWVTAGTTALVPRLVGGITKGISTGEGAVRGLSIAAKSGLMEKANTIGRFTPFLKGTKAFAKFGEKALESTAAWEALSGQTAEKIVQEGGIVGLRNLGYHGSLMDITNKAAEFVPGGKKFLENWIYDPIDWVKSARMKDIWQQTLGPNVDIKAVVAAYNRGESIEPFLKEAAEKTAAYAKTRSPSGAIAPHGVFDIDLTPSISSVTDQDVERFTSAVSRAGLEEKVTNASEKIVAEVDDVASILKDPVNFVSTDPVENAIRITEQELTGGAGGITLEDIEKVIKSGEMDQTGIRWFDNMMKGIKNFNQKIDTNGNRVAGIGQKTMDWYERGMSIFRVSKVAASPTAWTNAIVGNLLMNHMSGGLSNEFLNTLNLVRKAYTNKPGAAIALEKMMIAAGGEADIVRQFLRENVTATKGTFGSLDFLSANALAEKIFTVGRNEGLISSTTRLDDILNPTKEAIDEINVFKKAIEEKTKMRAGTTAIKEAFSEAGKDIKDIDRGTGLLANELFSSNISAEMFKFVEDKARANPSNLAWQLINFTMNKMPSGYEKIDQVFKMATFIHATHNGYTLGQIKKLSNIVNIAPEEIALGKYVSKEVGKTGQNLYKLSPKTAIELANVQYLNYNAMPAAIRVLRNIPLLSSPFISFMYGMTLKTGQTLAYNPSAFNKVTFALNEFGGTKNPLEKKLIYDNTKDPVTGKPYNQFYGYLQQPGMFRLPDSIGSFFEKYPVYANLTSMIPYYSLNMFAPTQTTYGDSFREKIAGTIQKSPLLKDPVGNAMFENLILPLILGEATTPQGQFGQQLYPVDANLFEKAAYAGRNFAEAFVPNIYSYAGLLTPEAVADYIPSYKWRKLSRAMAGKNVLGKETSEKASSRVTREVLGNMGVSIQAPVQTQFTQGQQ